MRSMASVRMGVSSASASSCNSRLSFSEHAPTFPESDGGAVTVVIKAAVTIDVERAPTDEELDELARAAVKALQKDEETSEALAIVQQRLSVAPTAAMHALKGELLATENATEAALAYRAAAAITDDVSAQVDYETLAEKLEAPAVGN